MLVLIRKHSLLTSLLFLLVILISAWQLPPSTSIFALSFLLLSIAISVSAISEKHKALSQSERRRKIARDIMIFILSMMIAVILGGIMGQFAGRYAEGYAEAHWPGLVTIAGALAMMVSAFAVGFVIRWGMLKTTRS